MVDNTHRDGKFVNTFQLNATASSGYSLATFDPSVSLQALMVLKKVMTQKPEQMEIEDISGDESPEVVVNDDVATKPPEGDTCEDMEVSDMECDSPTDAKIEVASTVPVTSSASPASFPTPLMGFEVNSYRGYPPLLPPPVPPPIGTFPNSAHPIGTFPQPPHFLFPIPPPGHPPPPFLPPLAPIPPPLSVVQDHSHHTPKPTVEVSTASRREQRLKKENLSKELKEKILSQLKEVLLKDLQKKYINTVGMELAERHWESLQRDRKSSEKPSTNSLASSDEPYRRMLDSKAKGLLSQDGHLSLPGGKRNRFVNFKIPTISRGGSRRSDGVITMRRAAKTRQEHVLSPLYSDFSSSESESEKAIEKDKIKQDREEEEEQKEIEGDEDEVELDEETDEELKGVESEGEYYVSQPGEDELSSASDFSSFDEDEEEEAEEDDRGVESDVSSAVSKDKEPLTAPVPERTAKILDVSSGSEDGVAVDFESSVLDTAKVEENSLVQPMSTPPEELTVPSPPREKLASPPPIASPVFGKRSQSENERILSTFLEMGPDREDVEMFRSAWLRMREEGNSLMKGLFWAHYPSMIADPIMAPPPPKRRRHTPQRLSELSHKSGAARSEGYYKIDAFAKKDYVTTTVVDTPAPAKSQKQQKEGNKTSGRVNRAKQRRLASDFASAEISSDLIKYGHLKARKKMVRFARSSIHGWGLFALEKIPADEMVIEYVGEIIRSNTADEREHRYEAMGIGSSYLFRLDGESVIDATKRGGVARFINHCCDPNCYAKVIVIGSLKKIVIYSKRDIHANEEITYDYKFPIEDEKIPCLCGAPQCRGTLN
jgi:histone-lysine N-methyltransferase SETD1